MKKGKAPRFIVAKAQTTHDTKLFKNTPVTIRWVLLDEGSIFSRSAFTIAGTQHRYGWQFRGNLGGKSMPPGSTHLQKPKLWVEL